MNNLKKISAFPGLFALISLSVISNLACSDNGSGDSLPTVASSENLGLCTAENDGDTVFVAVENGKFACSSGSWMAVSSLGECTSGNENSVVQEENKSDYFYGVYFSCKSQEWRKASTPEIISGNACNVSIEGQFVADTIYPSSSSRYSSSSSSSAASDTVVLFDVDRWVCDGNVWRSPTTVEDRSNTFCGESTEGRFWIDSTYLGEIKTYVCDDYKWRLATQAELVTRTLCTESLLGKVVDDYICSLSDWRVATVFEVATGKLCTDDNAGESINALYPAGSEIPTDLGTMEIDPSSERLLTVCDSNWRLATDFEKEVGVTCKEDGAKKIDTAQKKVISSSNAYYVAYICKKSFWRELPEGEYGYGAPCTPELEGVTYTDSSAVRAAGKMEYVCSNSKWQK